MKEENDVFLQTFSLADILEDHLVWVNTQKINTNLPTG